MWQPNSQFKPSDLVWRNIALLLCLHIFAIHGSYHLFKIKFITFLWGFFVGLCSGQGITSGAHRLWAHRSYRAKLPLRILLAFFHTVALQTPIYDWVRDHRVHHKYTDTDADPHNAARGFFFSHMGWLLVRKHPQVVVNGRKIDLSDIERDPVVMLQKRFNHRADTSSDMNCPKYYKLFAPILCLALPALVPWCCFNEELYVSWTTTCVLRYVLTLHGTWCVNSVAHIWGNKPYDKYIKPTENLAVSIFAFGEGWHNYHHVFPWDYKTGELGHYGTNLSTGFIDFMAKIGWAYDLKTVSEEVLGKRKIRTGEVL